MLAIAHFAIGIAFALLALLFFNKTFTIKYDLFIIFISGFWALLPDITKLWGSKAHHEFWQNIFWFHTWLDTLPDSVTYASICLLVACILLAVYYYKIFI